MQELITIQNKIKVGKNKYNSFGGFAYRSTEDILEAVKPLLHELNCILTLTDNIINIGNRYYVQATATLVNSEGVTTSTTAYAREGEHKKGMDEAQLSGAASSYARKYALSGLLLLDDAKDADTDEYTKLNKEDKQAPTKSPVIEKAKDYKMIIDACQSSEQLKEVWKEVQGMKTTNPARFEELKSYVALKNRELNTKQ